jgi:hypothetical protein
MNRQNKRERIPRDLTDIEAIMMVVRLMRRSTTRKANRKPDPEAV